MREVKLEFPSGYDRNTQAVVGLFAAQFDDLSRKLKRAVDGLDVRHLEWQPAPGMNTVGMLLAHLALVEIWWIVVAAKEIPEKEERRIVDEILGTPNLEDGMPLPVEGNHPDVLRGIPLENYLNMLDKARARVHIEMQRWKDSELGHKYKLRDDVITWEWTLYHVLEHFAGHYGQVQMLKHLMRNAGVLEKK